MRDYTYSGGIEPWVPHSVCTMYCVEMGWRRVEHGLEPFCQIFAIICYIECQKKLYKKWGKAFNMFLADSI